MNSVPDGAVDTTSFPEILSRPAPPLFLGGVEAVACRKGVSRPHRRLARFVKAHNKFSGKLVVSANTAVQVNCRTREMLWTPSKAVIDRVSATDALNCFTHAGYTLHNG